MVFSSKISAKEHTKIAIKNFIKKMDLSEGTKLPTEREFARILAVSRDTVRGALEDLESEGTIIRLHGKGTFANPEARRIAINLNPGAEFSQMIRKSGHKARMEIYELKEIPADALAANALRIEQGTPLVVLEKVFYADEKPAIICIDRFQKELLKEDFDIEQFKEMSTFDVLKKIGHQIITRDKIEIEALAIEQLEKYSKMIRKMECKAGLVFHGINYNQENEPIVYDTEIYDTAYIRFNLMRMKRMYEETEE